MGTWFSVDNLEGSGLSSQEKRQVARVLVANTWTQSLSGEVYCIAGELVGTLSLTLFNQYFKLCVYSNGPDRSFIDLCVLKYTSLGRRLSKAYAKAKSQLPDKRPSALPTS